MNEKMKIYADRCIGCGACVAVSPNNFKLVGNKAIVTKSMDKDISIITGCPVEAIYFE